MQGLPENIVNSLFIDRKTVLLYRIFKKTDIPYLFCCSESNFIRHLATENTGHKFKKQFSLTS